MVQNNQPPDVLNLNSFSSYAKDGLLYAADEVLSPKTRDDFLEAFARGGTYRGALYGFPILSSARAFFYNKALFARAGIEAPPKTWDELVQDARKLQALGGGIIGYALPLGPEEAQAEWSIWMWNNGGDWKSGERWTINGDRNVQTLTFLADLANKHRVTQVNPGKTNRTDGAFQLFKDGKVGMVMGFSPLARQLDAEGKVEYGVATMPTNVGAPVTRAAMPGRFSTGSRRTRRPRKAGAEHGPPARVGTPRLARPEPGADRGGHRRSGRPAGARLARAVLDHRPLPGRGGRPQLR